MARKAIRVEVFMGVEIAVYAIETRFGTLFECDNNYGEPKMENKAYTSIEVAIASEKVEIDNMLS